MLPDQLGAELEGGRIRIALDWRDDGNEAPVGPATHVGRQRSGRVGRPMQQACRQRRRPQHATMQQTGQAQVVDEARLSVHFVGQVQTRWSGLAQQTALGGRFGKRATAAFDVEVGIAQQRPVVAQTLTLRRVDGTVAHVECSIRHRAV